MSGAYGACVCVRAWGGVGWGEGGGRGAKLLALCGTEGGGRSEGAVSWGQAPNGQQNRTRRRGSLHPREACSFAGSRPAANAHCAQRELELTGSVEARPLALLLLGGVPWWRRRWRRLRVGLRLWRRRGREAVPPLLLPVPVGVPLAQGGRRGALGAANCQQCLHPRLLLSCISLASWLLRRQCLPIRCLCRRHLQERCACR